MICGRKSLVRGIRLLVFHRMYDGPYNVSQKKKQKETVQKTAVSRIMVAALKMSFFFFSESAVAEEMGSKPTRQTRSDSPMHTCTVGRRSEN